VRTSAGSPSAPAPSPASRSSSRTTCTAAHYHSDDLDATFEKLRASGAEIVQEPTEQPWGTRDCAVRDPSGNLVRIDQPPAAAP
jgi:uncharacterized glyoxalase superfamily protein PhnB